MCDLMAVKSQLSDAGDLPMPMSADANLSSDDTLVECLLERFDRERAANKSSDPVLSRSAGETSDAQFLEVAGLGRPARERIANDLLKLEQRLKDIHVAEILSPPKTMATISRMGLRRGLVFDTSCSCWDLNVRTNAERLCRYLQTERPVLSDGSPKCKASMDLQVMGQRIPKFQKTLEAGLSHLKSLMEIYRWQS